VKTEVKERPILFHADMVRAVLSGQKTQTRRVIRPQPTDPGAELQCPYGLPGDRLWVREPWWRNDGWDPHRERVALFQNWDRSTHTQISRVDRVDHLMGDPSDEGLKRAGWVKHPSIHMPRWACRLTLLVTDVRAEHLWNITADDLEDEGFELTGDGGAWDQCREAWDEMYRRQGFPWLDNPWVWVISFVSEGATP
jgi:hypothetical protein